jgi:hypothetical protein
VVGLGRCVGGVVGVYKGPGPIRLPRARRRCAETRRYTLIDQVMRTAARTVARKNCKEGKEVIVLLFDYVHSSARSMLS